MTAASTRPRNTGDGLIATQVAAISSAQRLRAAERDGGTLDHTMDRRIGMLLGLGLEMRSAQLWNFSLGGHQTLCTPR